MWFQVSPCLAPPSTTQPYFFLLSTPCFSFRSVFSLPSAHLFLEVVPVLNCLLFYSHLSSVLDSHWSCFLPKYFLCLDDLVHLISSVSVPSCPHHSGLHWSLPQETSQSVLSKVMEIIFSAHFICINQFMKNYKKQNEFK